MIVFWVFGAPLLVLFILYRNRNSLQEPYMKRYFLILYQGLKRKAFYWEFVNTVRKILMPAFNVLLATFNSFYRAMVAIIILVALLRFQEKMHPYKQEENNQVEMLAIITGMVTLFSAIIFIGDSEDDVEFLQLFALIAILFINLYFILRWIHIFMYAFKSKHPLLATTRRILGYALLRNRDLQLTTESADTQKTEHANGRKQKTVTFKKKKVIKKKRIDLIKRNKKRRNKASHTKIDDNQELEDEDNFQIIGYIDLKKAKMQRQKMEAPVSKEWKSSPREEKLKKEIRDSDLSDMIEMASFEKNNIKTFEIKRSKKSSKKNILNSSQNSLFKSPGKLQLRRDILDVVAEDYENMDSVDDTIRQLKPKEESKFGRRK